MKINTSRIIAVLKRSAQAFLVLGCGYLLVIVGLVIWTFEVRLQRWPTFIYSAPFTLKVGDNLEEVKLLERLGRLGHVENQVVVQEPGQWSQSGAGLNINLKYSHIKDCEIVSGPVSISLDWNQIRSIRLMRSMLDVGSVTLEPELVGIIPVSGGGQELCRPVALQEVPSLLRDTIVMTEDPQFFSHGGLDLSSIQRALKTNIKARRYVQGASTIPQQLVRMAILTPEKTLWRKLNEMALAIGADTIYSKDTILEAYLNRVYLGHWGPFPIKGVAEASRNFFGKDLRDLNPAECALIAAIIRAPNVINPHRHPERARARRNMVLGLMLKTGRLSRDGYEEAIEAPVSMRKPGSVTLRAEAFLDIVRDNLHGERVAHAIPPQAIVTSLDPILQSEAEAALKKVGDAGLLTHFIVASPRTGQIKALIAPGPQKWNGSGGNIETFLPFAIMPALIPEKREEVRFTLASQVFSSTPGGVPLTLRKAFQDNRHLLINRLSSIVGTNKIVSVLKEFGVNSQVNATGHIVPAKITPMQMAQCYSLLATMGSAPQLGPGIRTLSNGLSDQTSGTIRASVDPSIIFLVNYLLKGFSNELEKDVSLDRAWSIPSVFSSVDFEGQWNIAYRSDTIVVLRTFGHDVNQARLKGILAQLMPKQDEKKMTSESVPDGVVFRKICLRSGLLATSTCSHVIREPFLKGTQPVQWCPYSHELEPIRSDLRQ